MRRRGQAPSRGQNLPAWGGTQPFRRPCGTRHKDEMGVVLSGLAGVVVQAVVVAAAVACNRCSRDRKSVV